MKRILLILFAAIGLFLILKTIFLGGHPDFEVYYAAARAFLEGKNFYLATSSAGTTFIYPPIALLLAIPFSIFPFLTAQMIWTAISILVFLISVLLLLTINNEKFFSNRFLFLFGMAFFSFPAKFTLGMGQINMFILLLLVVFLYFIQQKRSKIAAFFLSLGFNIKLFPLLLPILFIIRKQWKLLFYIISFTVGICLFSVIIFSPRMLWEFLSSISPGIVFSTRTDYYNQALSGFVFRLMSVSTPADIVIKIISVVLLLVTVYFVWRDGNKKKDLFVGLIITLQLLINSFSWQHYFVWLLIPYAQIFYSLVERRARKSEYIPLFLSYFLTQSNLAHPYAFPLLFQSHVFFGTLFLWGYILYIIHKDYENSLSH